MLADIGIKGPAGEQLELGMMSPELPPLHRAGRNVGFTQRRKEDAKHAKDSGSEAERGRRE
jgi:hypothetical protein